MKRLLQPNTTLYPVSVVLVTCGHGPGNVLTANRISSCNAEPPMLAISIRPERFSHDLIQAQRDFAVNIPTPEMGLVVDYVGVVSGREEDKWEVSGLTRVPAVLIRSPLIGECPVNIECRVVQAVPLPSHTLFIGEVVALHAAEDLLNDRGEVDWARAQPFAYAAGVVRERPVPNVNVARLREQVRTRRLG